MYQLACPSISGITYLPDGLIDLLLVWVHLSEGSDLCEVHTLSVTQGYDLVKSEDQLERLVQNFRLLHNLAVFRHLWWKSPWQMCCTSDKAQLWKLLKLRLSSNQSFRPNLHQTIKHKRKQMEPALANGSVHIGRNIKGFARKFACSRPVWIAP